MRKLYTVIHRVEGWMLATAILVMAAVTIVNVFARNLAGNSIAATEELTQFLIVLVCFIGLSYAAGEGRHIRMSAVSDALPVAPRRLLMITVCSSTSALLLLLSWYAMQYALGVDRQSPVMGVPLKWIYMVAPLGLFMGGVQYAFAALRNLTGSEVYVSFDRLDGPEPIEAEQIDGPRQGG